MSPFVADSVELPHVILYHIINTFACIVQVGQLARDFG
jgi:hypothetical protein